MSTAIEPAANYLIFSDVHLGADLVQHVRPWTFERLKQIARIDRDLATMLDWYREHRDPERPWRLVIAGDLVDFIGMSIAPREGDSELSAEERVNGLGSTRDRAVSKMRAVARRHSLVFEKLARFVADGHSLVLVRGNHDIDFHWEDARAAFVEAILERAPEQDPAALAARIEFHPWFYYVEGLLYVEHGHQYDELCSYPNLLAPVQPDDPRRISWSLSDYLLRFVVRPTPGIGSEGHEDRGAIDYLRLGVSLGVRGGLRLGYRYLQAGWHALRSAVMHLGGAADRIREEHERGLVAVAARTRLGLDRLRALAALAPPSATTRPFAIARALILDRIALATLTVLVMLGVLVLDLDALETAMVAAPTVGAAVGLAIWSARFRVIDPSHAMRRSAESIARMLPVLYVVMGHTHEPVVERLEQGASRSPTYVNVGNWAVDDLDGPDRAPPRTHLVIRHVDGRPVAEFCAWDPELGPRPRQLG